MAAYRRLVYDSCHLQADCQEPGSAPEAYAQQSSIGYLRHFYSYIRKRKKTLFQAWYTYRDYTIRAKNDRRGELSTASMCCTRHVQGSSATNSTVTADVYAAATQFDVILRHARHES